MAQDCSAIPPGLLEAEMFGHETGAFTGAARSKPGCLLEADGGTFYLDNVHAIPLEAQSKLLRVLETGQVRPLGAAGSIPIDVRFIASSQHDLRELCERGELRKDLLFRLSGVTLRLPPLRERAEDVPQLVQHFRRQLRGAVPELTRDAMEALKSHDWPGNVRELESLVRRLALTAEKRIDKAQVERALGLERSRASFPRWIFEGRSYDDSLEAVKREYLLHLFERHAGDVHRIAAALGTTKRNVYLRYAQAGLRVFGARKRET